MFDFIEEALNQMALFVNKPVALAGLGPAATRRDDRLHAPFLDGLYERIGVIALVADKGLGTCGGQRQQSLGLTDVAGLSAGQNELQWVSQGIGDGVDLGAEAPTRTSQGLALGVTLRGTRCARVGAVNRGIDKNRLQIR